MKSPSTPAEIKEGDSGVFKGFFFELTLPNPDKPNKSDMYTVYSGVAERITTNDPYGDLDAKSEVIFSPTTVILRFFDGEKRFTRDGLRALCEKIIQNLDEMS